MNETNSENGIIDGGTFGDNYSGDEIMDDGAFTGNVFSIKLSQPAGIENLLDFSKKGNTQDSFIIDGLSRHQKAVKIGDFVFIVAGGDKSKREIRELNHSIGLYGVGIVVKDPYDISGKFYKIDIKFQYFFSRVLTQDDFYSEKYTKNIPNIGASTKGEPNQAIKKLSLKDAKNVFNAVFKITSESKLYIYNLFPWLSPEVNIPPGNTLYSALDDMEPGLDIHKVADVFSKYIINHNADNTSTLVGIFGKWGRGKTYFYDIVEEEIEQNHNNEFYFCRFQPWKYQKKESAWAYLYKKILDTYLESRGQQYSSSVLKFIVKTAAKIRLNKNKMGNIRFYTPILLGLFLVGLIYKYTDFIEGTLSLLTSAIGVSGLMLFIKNYKLLYNSHTSIKSIVSNYIKTQDHKEYLGFQHEIEYELKILLETFIDTDNKKLILFVDDLDRCNEEMIIDIIDGLRLVLDNEDINNKVIIITAIDERILTKAIQHKYFTGDQEFHIGEKEYIEKFFLIGLKFGKLEDDEIDELVDLYSNQYNKIVRSESESHEESSSLEALGETQENKVNAEEGEQDPSDDNEPMQSETEIINQNELEEIKSKVKEIGLETPRKINILIHRYLLFKSLMVEILEDPYLDDKMLVQLVVYGQDENRLKFFKDYYLSQTDDYIKVPLADYNHVDIERGQYIQLIKLVDMVTPF